MNTEDQKKWIVELILTGDSNKDAGLRDIIWDMMGEKAVANLYNTLKDLNAVPGSFFITHIGQAPNDSTFSVAYSIEDNFVILDE